MPTGSDPINPASDVTFDVVDIATGGDIYVNPSADVNLDCPDAVEGVDKRIWHVGAAFTLTLRTPAAATIATLTTGDYFHLMTYIDSSGVPQYYV